MSEKCTAKVYHSSDLDSYPCSRDAKVTRDGKGYCTQHDPMRVKRLEDESMAKYQAESNTRHAKIKRANICTTACEGISDKDLEAGVIQEMVKVLHEIVRVCTLPNWSYALTKAQEVLAKLGKEQV